MNGRKWMNLLAVLSVGALHAESVFATASSTVKNCGSATGKSAEKCCEGNGYR